VLDHLNTPDCLLEQRVTERSVADRPEIVADLAPWNPSAAAALVSVRALWRGIDHYRRAWATRLDLGAAEIVTLAELLQEPQLRTGDLVARTGLAQGSVTALVDRLEKRGLVERIRPVDNRRVVLVDLTTEGRSLAEAVFVPLGGIVEGALSDAEAVDAGDVEGFSHAMERVAELVERAAEQIDES
jgi:DNA-binding MarR family transcriptional regulator